MPSASSTGVEEVPGAIARASGLDVRVAKELPMVPAMPLLEVPKGPPTALVSFHKSQEDELEQELNDMWPGDQSANEKSPTVAR